jgi:hypothetical protein
MAVEALYSGTVMQRMAEGDGLIRRGKYSSSA